MKKTLLALSVAALAAGAGSAQAYNFHIDQTGTDVDFTVLYVLNGKHL